MSCDAKLKHIEQLEKKLELAIRKLEEVKDDCLTHVDRSWVVDSINKTLKEIKEVK